MELGIFQEANRYTKVKKIAKITDRSGNHGRMALSTFLSHTTSLSQQKSTKSNLLQGNHQN
jgi:hypothetical protein